jgi:hypothetical protein
MSRYSEGTRFEYSLRDWYRARGYTVVRSAGSHGPFDLLAFNVEGDVRLIQCKVQRAKKNYDGDIGLLKAVPCPKSWGKLLYVKTLYRTIMVMDAWTGNCATMSLGSFK